MEVLTEVRIIVYFVFVDGNVLGEGGFGFLFEGIELSGGRK